jgi:hypothetical protein
MPGPDATEVGRNSWGEILHYPEWQTLELRWLPTTSEMTDDGFRDTLTLHAGEGERHRPKFMLIDATAFHHRPAAETLQWRDEHIVPRYNRAGVTKFAFIASSGSPSTVESGSEPRVEGSALFSTGWFESREHAYEWLAQD